MRSKASWSPSCSGPAATNSCRIRGATAPAVLPTCASSTGTSRQRDHALPLGDDGVGEELLELGPARLVVRQEADRDAVAAERRQLRVEHAAEERVGKLHQDPRAVAGQAVRPGGAAVLEVRERGEGAHDRLVRGDGVEMRDERDAARVVLVRRVVETDAACHSSPPPVGCALVG